MKGHDYYSDCTLIAALYPLVAVWRHSDLICKPGMYRVVFCFDSQWAADNADAVCDDFGNLVRVSA